MIVCNRCVL